MNTNAHSSIIIPRVALRPLGRAKELGYSGGTGEFEAAGKDTVTSEALFSINLHINILSMRISYTDYWEISIFIGC